VVFIAVAVVLVAVADHFAVRWSESSVASRIERQFPGSHATVTVSSSPYLVRLVVFGTVEHVHAHVTDVTDGRLQLDTVDVTATDLKVDRGDLVHGKIRLTGLSSATVTASVSLAKVLRTYGLGDLAALGSLAPDARGTLQAQGNEMQVSIGPLRFAFTSTSLLPPCVGTAQLSAGQVILACTTHSVPPALEAAGASATPG
jgi:hypothetical protein